MRQRRMHVDVAADVAFDPGLDVAAKGCGDRADAEEHRDAGHERGDGERGAQTGALHVQAAEMAFGPVDAGARAAGEAARPQ